MKIAVPTEIKPQENRVGLTPASVRHLCRIGHDLFVQSGAGIGIGCDDETYRAGGAEIVPDAKAVFDAGELIIKVKEPQPVETAMLRPEQTLFTYLHLAPDPEQTEGLIRSGATAIAYETVTDDEGGLPLLKPMSQVAGRMSVQAGAYFLQKNQGGRGILLGGVPGASPARVLIIGGGVAGFNAAQMAAGLRAEVTILDVNPARLEELDGFFDGRVKTLISTSARLEEELPSSDLIICAVLVAGDRAPRLVSREQLKEMRRGTVLVDIAIDQGGGFESSRPTTHADPVFLESGIVHYCVTNMPGGVPLTATEALNAYTLPFIEQLASKGSSKALADNDHLARGLNVEGGKIRHPAVAKALPKFPAEISPLWEAA